MKLTKTVNKANHTTLKFKNNVGHTSKITLYKHDDQKMDNALIRVSTNDDNDQVVYLENAELHELYKLLKTRFEK